MKNVLATLALTIASLAGWSATDQTRIEPQRISDLKTDVRDAVHHSISDEFGFQVDAAPPGCYCEGCDCENCRCQTQIAATSPAIHPNPVADLLVAATALETATQVKDVAADLDEMRTRLDAVEKRAETSTARQDAPPLANSQWSATAGQSVSNGSSGGGGGGYSGQWSITAGQAVGNGSTGGSGYGSGSYTRYKVTTTPRPTYRTSAAMPLQSTTTPRGGGLFGFGILGNRYRYCDQNGNCY